MKKLIEFEDLPWYGLSIVIIHDVFSSYNYISCSDFNYILITLYLYEAYFTSNICENFNEIVDWLLSEVW